MVSTRKASSKKRKSIVDASSIDYNATCVGLNLPHYLTCNVRVKKIEIATKIIRDGHYQKGIFSTT